MRSSTETLIQALRILSDDIQSEDGVANAAILEASCRLKELYDGLSFILQEMPVEFNLGKNQYFSNACLRGLPNDEITNRFLEFKNKKIQ